MIDRLQLDGEGKESKVGVKLLKERLSFVLQSMNERLEQMISKNRENDRLNKLRHQGRKSGGVRGKGISMIQQQQK